MADDLFASISSNLTRLIDTTAALADHFDIGSGEISLRAPVSLASVETFFDDVFGSGTNLPELPFAAATIARFDVGEGEAETGLPARADVRVSFDGTARWPAADGFDIALVELEVSYWGGDWSGSVLGAVTVKGIEFDIRVSWPSIVVEGWLTTTSNGPDLARVVADHGLEPRPNKAPKLESLRLYAALRAHFFRLEISASDLLTIGPLGLDEVDLVIEYQGGASAAFTGAAHTELVVGDVTFQLGASKTVTGWTAELRGTGTTTLQRVVADVSALLYGVPHDLSTSGVPPELIDEAITGDVVLTIDTTDGQVTLVADVAVNGGKATFEIDIAPSGLTVRARLQLGDLSFEVDVTKQAGEKMLAAQFASEAGVTTTLAHLAGLARLTGDEPFQPIGGDISITVRDVLLAMASNASSKPKFLVAADIDGGIDLSGLGDLPLVGDMLPRDLSLRLSLAPVLVTSSWTADRNVLDALRGTSGPRLPDTLDTSDIGVSLQLPGERLPVEMGLSLGSTTSGHDVSIDTSGAAAPAPGDPGVMWRAINRSLGPVSIGRVGLALDKSDPADAVIRVLLDGTLGLAGLELSLVGLEARYGLTSKHLEVVLHGLGLQFDRPPLSIAGGFAQIGEDYVGEARLEVDDVRIVASGGFTMINGTPSMFIYGLLDTPIGGPPFFYVTGLAAGFGLNRNLTAPQLSQVHDFPFVRDAIDIADGKSVTPPPLDESLQQLAAYVRPQLGENFLAVGVRFTSFKLLDSFVLLMLSAGRELKVDIVGVSTFQSPAILEAGVPAVARIELDLVAAIRPDDGTVLVLARLDPSSYVYSPEVKLSGGFAFASWFKKDNAGDFVISAGGYHPRFVKPPHYPAVERIGLTFQVPGFDVTIKGSAYFALTPSMLMAGGQLQASAHFGKVSASFGLWLDFLMQWEPYHYEIDVGIEIAARWWVFSTHAGASLHVQGPKFAGYARVHWSAISFDVDFGHALGSTTSISWQKFQDSFLPHDRSGQPSVSPVISVAGGQISSIADPSGTTIHVVNPKELELTVSSVLPVAVVNGKAVEVGDDAVEFGCGPIGVTKVVSSELKVAFDDGDGTAFAQTVGVGAFPAAMWGPPTKPDLRAAATIKAGSSVTLRLADPVNVSSTPRRVRRDHVAYDPHDGGRLTAVPSLRFGAADPSLAAALGTGEPARKRDAIRRLLGVAPAIVDGRSDQSHGLRSVPATAPITVVAP